MMLTARKSRESETLSGATGVVPRVRLGDCTEFVLDGTHGSPVRVATGIPVLSAANVKDGCLNYETDRFTTAAEYEAYRRRLDISQGDVLLTIVGTIGRTAVVQEVQPHVFQRSVAVLRPRRDMLHSRYLFHWLNTSDTSRQLAARTNQSAQAGVYLGALKEILVPAPALSEQRRIADILDKADAIRRKRKQAIALTEELLRSAFLEMFGDPVTNPKGWRQERLGEMADVSRGRFSPRPRNDPRFYGGRYPFVQTGDIAQAPNYLTKWKQTLNEQGIRVSKAFSPGSVLVAIVGATIGETAVLGFESYCPDSVVGIVPRAPYTGEFLEYFLRFWKQRFRDEAPETARANINLETLRPIPVPVVDDNAIQRFSRLYQRAAKLTSADITAPYGELSAGLLHCLLGDFGPAA